MFPAGILYWNTEKEPDLEIKLQSQWQSNVYVQKKSHYFRSNPALATAVFDPSLVLTRLHLAEMLRWPQMPAACWQQNVALKNSAFFFSFFFPSEVLKTTQYNYNSSATQAEHWTCLSHSLTWKWHTNYKFHLAGGFNLLHLNILLKL